MVRPTEGEARFNLDGAPRTDPPCLIRSAAAEIGSIDQFWRGDGFVGESMRDRGGPSSPDGIQIPEGRHGCADSLDQRGVQLNAFNLRERRLAAPQGAGIVNRAAIHRRDPFSTESGEGCTGIMAAQGVEDVGQLGHIAETELAVLVHALDPCRSFRT